MASLEVIHIRKVNIDNVAAIYHYCKYLCYLGSVGLKIATHVTRRYDIHAGLAHMSNVLRYCIVIL